MNNKLPKVTVMIGISGSGKSTTAAKLINSDTVLISSDAIRKEFFGDESVQEENAKVFKLFYERMKTNLLQQKNVILDATNLTYKARKRIFTEIGKIPCYKEAMVVVKEVENCITDNYKRDRHVPIHVIENQAMSFEVPFYEEGFDEINFVNLTRSSEASIFANTLKQMNTFEQKTPYHDKTVGIHCEEATSHFAKLGYPFHLKLAARYHDIGKLLTQTFDEKGVAHYYGHEKLGAYYLLCNALNWGMDKRKLLEMVFLVNYHMKPFSWELPKTHVKYKHIFGKEKYQMLLDFHECDKKREINKENVCLEDNLDDENMKEY